MRLRSSTSILRRLRNHTLLALLLLVAPAAGQETADLRWKPEKDKTFYQQIHSETQQTLKVMGTDVNQTQSQTFWFSWTPKEHRDGNWVMQEKIEGVKTEMEINGNKISFDSTAPAFPDNKVADVFKALVGAEFTLTLGANLQIRKIDGREHFIKKLVDANPQIEPALKQILAEDALRQMAESLFKAVPNREVKKRETWKRHSKLNLGPIGTYEITSEYTYQGKENDLAKISVSTALKYQAPADGTSGGLPYRIKSADLKSQEATGTVWFDMRKGRVDSAESSLMLTGELSVEINNQVTTVELKQTQKTTTKVTDTNPIKK